MHGWILYVCLDPACVAGRMMDDEVHFARGFAPGGGLRPTRNPETRTPTSSTSALADHPLPHIQVLGGTFMATRINK